jgi:hypothetical protein
MTLPAAVLNEHCLAVLGGGRECAARRKGNQRHRHRAGMDFSHGGYLSAAAL